jgi:hypothetical protein
MDKIKSAKPQLNMGKIQPNIHYQMWQFAIGDGMIGD